MICGLQAERSAHTRPPCVRSGGRLGWPLEVIVSPLFPKFRDELPGGTLEGGGNPTFADMPFAASEAATKLADRDNDKVRQSDVGQAGNEFVQLGWG